MKRLLALLGFRRLRTKVVLATFHTAIKELDEVAKNNAEDAAEHKKKIVALAAKIEVAEREIAESTAARAKLASFFVV